MELSSYFRDFLRAIRPTQAQRDDYKRGHQTLRDRLSSDERLGPLIVSTFLQGSYRRATAVRPSGNRRPDVDVIVVTKLSEDEYTPSAALECFRPFLQQHYAGKYRYQGRSIGIELSYVDMDLVVTSAPSEAQIGILRSEAAKRLELPEDIEELLDLVALVEASRKAVVWKRSPLRIPDRDVEEWEDTHPLEQIRWTIDKNTRCNTHYINVVKALKWWRQQSPALPKYPKSYPFERLIGQYCPDGISSVAMGVTLSLEAIAALPGKPFLPDHGVPTLDVMHRVTNDDFDTFLEQVRAAATLARRAFDAVGICESTRLWKKLFGEPFPDPPEGTCDEEDGEQSGYSERVDVTTLNRNRFA